MSREITLRLHRLDPDVPLPAYHSVLAAGMDLHAAIPTPRTLHPGEIALIPCGFAMELPEGYEAQVRPRSGLASRYGVTMPNAPGTIDADYRGPVQVPLINLGRESFIIEPHMRIAQMIIAAVVRARVVTVATLSATTRGTGGFGSTGL